ncbi:MAG: nucleotide exchange factor GrpE [Spirochaetales bacterium]|uniref:Protein GrpE n=1 Tax=Candidatus Thalassospirochaeta sargassi TaxID=3119039 RepID=A0AAJ1ICL0_9SPIO|nr:nucleotide exchange factor GrpE [Spirochaetales bacterium]
MAEEIDLEGAASDPVDEVKAQKAETGKSGAKKSKETEKEKVKAEPKAARKDKEIKKLQSEIEDYAGKLVEAKNEIDELKDQYLRKQADFDNFRKRMLREKEDSIKFANTALLNDIISVIDDFERALQSSEESQDFKAFHSGIEMIEKQMISMLESNWGLKRFDSAGEPFDPEKHEALMMEESTEVETQTVLEDFMKGYQLHDRVIRHAKVKVAKPAPAPQSGDE